VEIAKVIGTVVATRKDESLIGKKLLIVQPLTAALSPVGNVRVVADTVGAGMGELVICVSSSAARRAVRNEDAALDGAVVGIIDDMELDERLLESLTADS